MGRRVLSAVVTVVLTTATLMVVATSSASAITVVVNEAELRAAFATDSDVQLGSDITLRDCGGADGGAVTRPASNTTSIRLDGRGFAIRQTCPNHVLVQLGVGLLTLQGITITGGTTEFSGGGVFAQGDLTVIESTITGNRADQFGGGLVTNGALDVQASNIVGNGSGEGGGGVQAALSVTVNTSNVSNNLNGGIATSPDPSAHVTVVNSTIDHNTQAGLGGGIFSGGPATLVYATVTDNAANEAFANLDIGGELSSFGSVVTNSTGAVNCLVGSSSASQGYNFSSDTSCNFTAATDRQDAGDPRLGTLGANGGFTQTRLPLAGSPLLDAIPAAACAPGVTTDQRLVARPQHGFCDIGAVELLVSELEALTPATPASPTTPSVTPVVVSPRFTG